MRTLLKNNHGAVTVFITLLLVPAMLVSGTAVDLARIHSARSILQDANQLAANSVLTQYDALLYDLYGLFGVAQDDPVFGSLLNEYINVAVFGETGKDVSLGTFQLFYGANLSTDGPAFVDNKNLRNEDVLRAQIEEYMKFRAPVILVKSLLDAFSDNKLKEDLAVVNDKLAIDDDLMKLIDKYKELYNAIVTADKCTSIAGGIVGGYFGSVSTSLTAIRSQFVELRSCYSSWESVDPDEEESGVIKADIAAKYYAILDNIMSLTIGGPRGTSWSNGGWVSTNTVAGLNKNIENAIKQADDFKPNFDTVSTIAAEIDEMHNELERKLDELERKLESGECSEELAKGFTEKTGSPPKSMMDKYRDLLKYDNVKEMADSYTNGGYSYIDTIHKPMLEGVRYRNVNAPASSSLSRTELAAVGSNPMFNLNQYMSSASSRAAHFAGFPDDAVTYKMAPGFKKFSEYPNGNAEFFEFLKALMDPSQGDPVKLYDGQEDAEGSDTEKKQRSIIDAVLEMVESAYYGLTNNPIGAKHINDANTPEPERMGILEILTLIPQAIADPIVSVVTDPLECLSSAGDYLLLLTYSTSMFSNYTTTKPASIGKTKDESGEISFTKSVTGVPISPEVNYFFQSEWEYLYKGSSDAGENLSAVTRLLFLIRLVCNYVAVFQVSAVTTVVSSIQVAFAWAPPIGMVLGELARAAFVAAETLIDIASLRSGHKVPLIKKASNGEWVCSPSGIISAIGNIVANELVGGDDDEDGQAVDDEKGLAYHHYMLIFFVAKAVFYIGVEKDGATEFAKRTGNLIEWNIINYKEKVNADEEKMSAALQSDDRFELEKQKTDFSLTTTANMRMLFLSMPFARNYFDGRGIAGLLTVPVTVTDYRGY